MKFFLALLLISGSFFERSYAQKIDKFCEVVFVHKGFGNRVKISVDLGATDSLFQFKDTCVISELKKTETFHSEVDALNYMSLLGWTWIGNSMGGSPTFIFKRSFDISELKKP